MEIKMRYGNRPALRDKILGLLADGKERHISEIEKELEWSTTTSISKTLMEVKEKLIISRDSRRLRRKKFNNANKGTIWWLERNE